MEKLVQCKDFDDRAVLEAVWGVNDSYGWSTWYENMENSIAPAFGSYSGEGSLIVAKMEKLRRRGFLGGCTCGCRGDFTVTQAGCDFIGRPMHAHPSLVY